MRLELALSFGGAVFCAALAGFVLLRNRKSFVQRTFALGMAALAAEAVLTGLGAQATGPEEVLRWQRLRLLATALLPGSWLLFSLAFARFDYQVFVARSRWVIAAMFAAPLALATLFADSLFVGAFSSGPHRWVLPLEWAGYAFHLVFLVGAVLVLMNLERSLRASTGSMRWLIKFMTLGVGAVFAIRIYTSSQTLLFVSMNTALHAVNSGALVLAAVLMMVSLFRTRLRDVDVYVSQSVLYQSVVLLLVGIYLLAVGVLSRVVTSFGGARALPVATFLMFAALLSLTAMLLSDELRQKVRRFVSRNFHRPQYDYRKEWMAFTHRTGSIVDMRALCTAVARMVSETLRVPSVTLWLLDERQEGISLGGSTVYSDAQAAALSARCGAGLVRIMRERPAPVDLHDPALWGGRLPDDPDGLLDETRHGLALSAGREPLGFVFLGDRSPKEPLSTEDYDLLRTVADQAASSLLNLRLSERLLRAKEMEAFQSLSAFFVHDLKNLASKLSLTMQNLPAHYDDEAFRSDLLAVISRSVTKINEMCSRLSPLSRRLELEQTEIDLNELVGATLESLNGAMRGRLVPELNPVPPLVADPGQLQRVLVNLILNANDAVGDGGEVRVATGILDDSVFVSVRDNGCGMPKEFIARSLFQPFQTTKGQGLGIGLYHSKKIVEAHRGRIEVESEEGKGSTFRVVLPAETA